MDSFINLPAVSADVSALDWQDSVINRTRITSVGLTPTVGDRYIIAGTGGLWSSFTINDIVEYTSGGWVNYIPNEGYAAWDETADVVALYNGATWSPLVAGIPPIGASTNNAIVRWSGVLGAAVKNSSVIVDDSGNITAGEVYSTYLYSSSNLTVDGNTELGGNLTLTATYPHITSNGAYIEVNQFGAEPFIFKTGSFENLLYAGSVPLDRTNIGNGSFTQYGNFFIATPAVCAVGVMILTGLPVLGEKFNINGSDHTFVVSPSGANEIELSTVNNVEQANFIARDFNLYSSQKVTVYAVSDLATGLVKFICKTAGVAGNAIAFTESMSNCTVNGGGFLGGTVAGVNQANSLNIDKSITESIYPEVSHSWGLGTSSNCFKDIYADDVHFSSSIAGGEEIAFIGTTESKILMAGDYTYDAAKTLANSLKAIMNVHAADGTEHAHGGGPTPDITDFPVTESDATDWDSLVALTNALTYAYSGHAFDGASAGGGLYHNAQTAFTYQLNSSFPVYTMYDIAQRLNQIKLRYNQHEADVLGHTVGSAHTETNSDVPTYGFRSDTSGTWLNFMGLFFSPEDDGVASLGYYSSSWKELWLNNGTTDGGTLHFNGSGSGSSYLQSSSDGLELKISGFDDAALMSNLYCDGDILPSPGSAIVLANSLKANMNGHFTSRYGAHSDNDFVSTITEDDSTHSLADLKDLIDDLITGYVNHDTDATLGAGSLYHKNSAYAGNALASIVSPTTIAECLTRLADIKAKYNAHEADASAHYTASLFTETHTAYSGDWVLGNTNYPFKSLTLNNDATDGGAVYFNASTTSFIKSTADGLTLNIDGFTSFTPTVTNTVSLGDSSHTYKDVYTSGKLYLGDSSPIFALQNDGAAWIKDSLIVGAGAAIQAKAWSASLFSFPSAGLGTPSFGTCTFDLTGGTYENLLTATVQTGGWSFTANDVHKVILLTSGAHLYACAMIEEYISATQVRLETCDWDDDVVSESFIMLNIPITFTSRKLKVNTIPATGEWESNAANHTGEYCSKFDMSAAGNTVTNLRVVSDSAGYSNVDSIQIKHTTGDLSAGELCKVIRLTIDDEACTGGATVEVDGIKFNRIKGDSVAKVNAINVGTDFTNALHVDGAPAIDPGYGYTFTAAFAVIDRVNSGGGGDDSFINPAVNTQMFTADNTGILIGSDNPFAVIEYIQQVAGSGSITPVWQYSTGDGTWATLVVSDTTTNMRFSGKISFTPPALWAKSAHCDGATGAITDAYYIRITRTANALATPPTEQYFKIYEGASATDTLIRGDGTIKPAQLADASAPNDSIYYSTTASKLVYKDPGGTVRNLY